MTPEVKAENAARDHNAIQRRAHSHLLQGRKNMQPVPRIRRHRLLCCFLGFARTLGL